MGPRIKVGIDLAPIAFRHRAPGTAVHVENQARALLALEVEWDWVLIATPRVLADTPFFKAYNPIVVPDMPLSIHATFRVGHLWSKAGCALGLATVFFVPITGPPVVTNYFDASAHDADPAGRTLKFRILQYLATYSRWRSRALFILSEYGRRRMIEVAPATEAKWVVTHCGCPPVPPKPSQAPVWAARLKGDAFILYAGEMNENKNQRRLIRAWDELRRRFPDFPSLVLLGPGKEDYVRDVIDVERNRSAAPEDVIIGGYVPADELSWAFWNAYAYVQPSFGEGFGLPIVEAMSCGLPVACSNTTSLPEIADDAALLFDPADVSSIAAALERLVFDEAERERLRHAGPIRAHSFTWENHARVVAERIRSELSAIQSKARRGRATSKGVCLL